MQPSISVIIPVRNNLSELKNCLLSLKQNNYSNKEIIIVDDCSDADIEFLAREFDCIYLRNQKCLGPLRSRLKGLETAKNEIIAFIDSDCSAPENWLENLVLFLRKDIVGIGGIYEYEKNNTLFSKFLSLFSTYWFSRWKKGKTDFLLGGNCAYWKDKLIEFINYPGMDLLNTLASGDDTLFNLEIAKKYKLIFIPELKVRHAFFPLAGYLRRQINWAFSRMLISFFNPREKLLKTKDFQAGELLLQLLFTAGIIGAVCSRDVVLLNSFVGLFLLSHIRPLVYFLKNEKNAFFLFYALGVLFLRNIMYFGGISKAIMAIIKQSFLRTKESIIIGFNIINPFVLSKLHFFVTKYCNARCSYCFNKDSDNQSKADLDIAQIILLTEKIGIMPYLIITGGEPFLREDIAEICDLFYKKNLTRFFVLTSNGYFTDRIINTARQILSDCPRARLTVQISLDGIGIDNDLAKDLEGLNVNCLRTLRQLNDLKRFDLRLLINISTVISRDNADKIEDLIAYIKKENLADFHFVSPLRGIGQQAKLQYMDIDRYFKIVQDLKQKSSNKNNGLFKFLYGKVYNRALLSMKKILTSKCEKNKCFVWRKIAIVDNAANVLLCELQMKTMGNLLQADSLSSIRRSKEFKRETRNIIKTNCYCNWGCAIAANIVFDPKEVIRAFCSGNTE